MLISNIRKNFGKIFLEKNFKFPNVKAKLLNDVVKDVNNYHNFVPMCEKSKIIDKKNSNIFYGKLDINYKIYQDSYISKVICKKEKKNNLDVYKISSFSNDNKIFNFLTSDWEITEKNNITFVNYKLQFEMKNYIYSSVTNTLKNYITDKTVNAMVEESIKKQNILEKNNSNFNNNWIFDLLEKVLVKEDFKHLQEIFENKKFAKKMILLMNYFNSEKKLKQNRTEFLFFFRDIYNDYKTERVIN